MNTLATQSVSPLLLPPSILREILENVKRGMTQYPSLALPNDPSQDIQSYYELILINLVVFYDYLIIIRQVPLVDKPLIMNVYKVYNLPVLHLVLYKTFWYSVEGEYLVLSSDSEYASMCIYQGTQVSIWCSTVPNCKCFLVSLHICCKWCRMNLNELQLWDETTNPQCDIQSKSNLCNKKCIVIYGQLAL